MEEKRISFRWAEVEPLCLLRLLLRKWWLIVMAALIGARKLHHLEENVKAAQIVLDAADAARMTADSDAARQKIAVVKKH